jgi:transcriptional regulator with XRE-family HTH domain
MNAARPFAGTRLPAFIAKSVLALKARKTQAEIATQAGFTSANMVSMLKAGSTRLPLDRVHPLAIALEVDPSFLMLLALEQMVGDTDAKAIVEILSGAVTLNEMAWIEALREASDMTDPPLTKRGRTAIFGIFGK